MKQYTPKTWLISDTHWNHEFLIKNNHRPEGFTELIIKNLQEIIKPEDTLYHLGDVILGKNGTLGEILGSIPGRKILVRGNHDHESDNWYCNHGFHFVAQGILVGGVWLSHSPASVLPSGAILNVHGHLHNSNHHGTSADYPQHCKLLAIENTGYKPVEFDEFVGFSPTLRSLLA